MRYVAADIAHLDAAIESVTAAGDDPVRRVLDFVQLFEDGADDLMSAQSNCLYVAVLIEQQLAAADTGAQIVTAIEAWRRALTALLRDALPAGSGIGAAALADHVFVTFEGAFLLCRSTGDAGHMRAQLAVLRELLAALLR